MSNIKYKTGDKPIVTDNKEFLDSTQGDYSGEQVKIIRLCNDDHYEVRAASGFTFFISDERLLDPYTEGEEVEVRNHKEWKTRTYVFTDKNNHHACICLGDEQRYRNGVGNYDYYKWDYIRKIKAPQIEMTAKINGKTVPLKDISADTFAKLQEAE